MMSDVKMKRIAEFLRGVGGIDDDLIAEASEEELKGHTIRRRVSFRGVCGGIAACLVLAAAVFVFPLLMDGNNGGNADGAPTEELPIDGERDTGATAGSSDTATDGFYAEHIYCVGVRIVTDGASLAYRGYNKYGSASFILTLGENASVPEFGVGVSAADAKKHIAGIEGGMRLTVNGESLSLLPTEAGTYEITINYEHLRKWLRALGEEVPERMDVYCFWDGRTYRFLTQRWLVGNLAQTPESYYTDEFTDVSPDGENGLY